MVLKQATGVAFIQDNKLLVVQSLRSSKYNMWTLVGGGVEDNETVIEGACREAFEEIGNGFTITPEDLSPILCFKEPSYNDSDNFLIEMTIYLSHKKIDVELIPNEEILGYHWYPLHEDNIILSSSIGEHLLEYIEEMQLMN